MGCIHSTQARSRNVNQKPAQECDLYFDLLFWLSDVTTPLSIDQFRIDFTQRLEEIENYNNTQLKSFSTHVDATNSSKKGIDVQIVPSKSVNDHHEEEIEIELNETSKIDESLAESSSMNSKHFDLTRPHCDSGQTILTTILKNSKFAHNIEFIEFILMKIPQLGNCYSHRAGTRTLLDHPFCVAIKKIENAEIISRLIDLNMNVLSFDSKLQSSLFLLFLWKRAPPKWLVLKMLEKIQIEIDTMLEQKRQGKWVPLNKVPKDHYPPLDQESIEPNSVAEFITMESIHSTEALATALSHKVPFEIISLLLSYNLSDLECIPNTINEMNNHIIVKWDQIQPIKKDWSGGFYHNTLGQICSTPSHQMFVTFLLSRGLTRPAPPNGSFYNEYRYLTLYYSQLKFTNFPTKMSLLGSLFYHFNPFVKEFFRCCLGMNTYQSEHMYLIKMLLLYSQRLQQLLLLVGYLPEIEQQEFIFSKLNQIMGLKGQFSPFFTTLSHFNIDNPALIHKNVKIMEASKIPRTYPSMLEWKTSGGDNSDVVLGEIDLNCINRGTQRKELLTKCDQNLSVESDEKNDSDQIDITKTDHNDGFEINPANLSLYHLHNILKLQNPEYWDSITELNTTLSQKSLSDQLQPLLTIDFDLAAHKSNTQHVLIEKYGILTQPSHPSVSSSNKGNSETPPSQDTSNDIGDILDEPLCSPHEINAVISGHLKHAIGSLNQPLNITDGLSPLSTTSNNRSGHCGFGFVEGNSPNADKNGQNCGESSCNRKAELLLVENIAFCYYQIWYAWCIYFRSYAFGAKYTDTDIEQSKLVKNVLQIPLLDTFFLKFYPSTYHTTISPIIDCKLLSPEEKSLSDGELGVFKGLYKGFYESNPVVRSQIIPFEFENKAPFLPLSLIDSISITTSGIVFRQPLELFNVPTRDEYYGYLNQMCENIQTEPLIIHSKQATPSAFKYLNPHNIPQPGETFNFNQVTVPGLVWWALYYSYPSLDDIMSLITHCRCDILNHHRQSTLMIAIAKQWPYNALVALARKSVNLNLIDAWGRNVLHYLCLSGGLHIFPELLNFLVIECGVIVNTIDAFGHSPLSYALYTFSPESSIKKLIDFTLTRFEKQLVNYYQYYEPLNLKEFNQNLIDPFPWMDSQLDDRVESYKQIVVTEYYSNGQFSAPQRRAPNSLSPLQKMKNKILGLNQNGFKIDTIVSDNACHDDDDDESVLNIVPGEMIKNGDSTRNQLFNYPFGVNYLLYSTYSNDAMNYFVLLGSEHDTTVNRPVPLQQVMLSTIRQKLNFDVQLQGDFNLNRLHGGDVRINNLLISLYGIMVRLHYSIDIIKHLLDRIGFGLLASVLPMGVLKNVFNGDLSRPILEQEDERRVEVLNYKNVIIDHFDKKSKNSFHEIIHNFLQLEKHYHPCEEFVEKTSRVSICGRGVYTGWNRGRTPHHNIHDQRVYGLVMWNYYNPYNNQSFLVDQKEFEQKKQRFSSGGQEFLHAFEEKFSKMFISDVFFDTSFETLRNWVCKDGKSVRVDDSDDRDEIIVLAE
jgi:hypothetical protein